MTNKPAEETGIQIGEMILADISPSWIPKNLLVDGKVRQFEIIQDGSILISIRGKEYSETFPLSAVKRVICGECHNRKVYNQNEERWMCPFCRGSI